MTRTFFLILTVLLPSKLKFFLYSKIFNWKIDKNANIGFSLVLCDKLSMSKGARIGNLTVIKKSVTLEMGKNTSLGSLNWVTGYPLSKAKHFSKEVNRKVLLKMGAHSAITNRHFIDCTDSVSIGKYTTIAGFRSQLLTHSIDLKKARQSCAPISIGDYCFIGTGSIFLPGSQVPSYSIVSAGSLINKKLSDEKYLYGGIPIVKIKKLDIGDYKYMSRKTGFIT